MDRYALAGLRDIDAPELGEKLDLISDLLMPTSDLDLNDAYTRYPSTVAFWTAVAGLAEAQVDEQKENLRVAERKLSDEIIPRLDTDIRRLHSGEKFTEARIANEVKLSPAYKQGAESVDAERRKLLKAKKRLVLLNAALAGVKAMEGSLIGLGANARAERSAEQLRINKTAN